MFVQNRVGLTRSVSREVGDRGEADAGCRIRSVVPIRERDAADVRSDRLFGDLAIARVTMKLVNCSGRAGPTPMLFTIA